MLKRINSKAALLVGGTLAALASNASAAGIDDIAAPLTTEAGKIAGLSSVALLIALAYLGIHHIKKGTRAAGS